MRHAPAAQRLFAALAAALCVLLGACATPHADAPAVAPAAPADSASATPVSAVAVAAVPAAPASAADQPPTAAADAKADAGRPVADAPVDPLRPGVAVDLNTPIANIDLWERVRLGFAMPDLDTPLVRSGEQWYASRPDYVQRMTERGSRYLFHIVEEVRRRGMPTELALLPFIESAFNPQAISSAKASGMWQFMPATGKHFELRQNVFRDDRRDVLASTRAALDYLQKLHDMFGDWHLALAAYNWGEGNVQRAIARNLRAHKPTDYLSLRMPRETAYYVPKLQAVKNLVRTPEAFGIALPALANHPYFLSVPIERDLDVALAIELAGITSEEFYTLNPQIDRPVILAAGMPQILLPYDNASDFVHNIAAHRGAFASWTAWITPRTLRAGDAARQVGMSEAQLCEVNKIPPRMLVRAGSTLLVPRDETWLKDVSLHVADNGKMTLTPEAPPPRRVTHRAAKGDSVATVAARYHVSAAQVAHWNKTSASASFSPGQAVLVFVQPKPVRALATRRHGKTKSKSLRHKLSVAQATPQ